MEFLLKWQMGDIIFVSMLHVDAGCFFDVFFSILHQIR